MGENQDPGSEKNIPDPQTLNGIKKLEKKAQKSGKHSMVDIR
jgi:hypothetical protein